MQPEALIDPGEFLGIGGIAHLCSGGEAPFLRRHLDALRQFAADKSGGMAGRDRLFAVYGRAKQLAAKRLGTGPDSIAFLAHSSEGLNQVARSIDWRAGDNVVVADVEFPSGILPFAALRPLGGETRILRARNHYVGLADVSEAINGRTRLIVASQVSYLTGQRLDLAALAALARQRGALLAVDATHALGVMPVDGTCCDFLVSSCYKWLLATHGVGIFACRPELVGGLVPASLGWHSVQQRDHQTDPTAIHLREDASRLEAGNPSFVSVYVLESALSRLAEVSATASLDHSLRLGGELIAGLNRRGYQVTTPEAPEERAGNICFLAGDAARLTAHLAASGVLVWGSEGRVRVSVHIYNSEADVARFFDALDDIATH